MITLYNIRGTNGSGKTTLARSFIRGDLALPANQRGCPDSPTMVDLTWYASPTKADPQRCKAVEGYASPHLLPNTDVLVVGSYRTACGGLDAVPDFGTSFDALDGAVRICREHARAQHQAIICEGVLASTVWGSWGRYAQAACNVPDDVSFAFCYLDTPLEVCLERIRKRQEAAGKVRDIKEDLVRDKIKAIAATRQRALDALHTVYDLPFQGAEAALKAIVANEWVDSRPGTDRRHDVKARELYRAR